MRNRAICIGARVLGLALLVATGVLGPSSTPSRASGSDQDATSYAAMFDVSLPEARRRLDLQRQIGALQVQLEAADPDSFAGLWIENRPTFGVVARYTAGDGAARVASLTNGTPLEGLVSVRTAAFALRTLRSDLLRLAATTNRPFAAGISVQENRIVVEVESPDGFAAWLRDTGVQLPESSRIEHVTRLPRPMADIYGGLALSICTSGFGVRHNSSGELGITTAGHCGNTISYQGTNLPFQSEAYGGWYDVQWHLAPGFTVRNWIMNGDRPIWTRTFWGSQVVGGTACKYGSAAGYGCGTIAQKDYIPFSNCIPDARPIWVRLEGASVALGDSGGPVFLTDAAYGTIACGSGTTIIYTAVDWVESGVGVTILTN